MGNQDLGHLPPAGTRTFTSPVWFENGLEVRPGSSLTTDANSTVTLNGTVTLGGSTSIGAAPANDLTESLSPSSAGLLAWNFPYALATVASVSTGSAAVTGGTLYLAKLPLAGGTVVTNLWFRIATAASGITAGECFGGLYSAVGALLATSADLSTAIGTNTGPIEAPMAAAYTVPSAGGNFYAGFFFNAATTEPVLGTFANQNTVTTGAQNYGSLTTFGNTAARFPFAVNTTGNTTALPTSLTMSSNSATGAYTYWVGVN